MSCAQTLKVCVLCRGDSRHCRGRPEFRWHRLHLHSDHSSVYPWTHARKITHFSLWTQESSHDKQSRCWHDAEYIISSNTRKGKRTQSFVNKYTLFPNQILTVPWYSDGVRWKYHDSLIENKTVVLYDYYYIISYAMIKPSCMSKKDLFGWLFYNQSKNDKF